VAQAGIHTFDTLFRPLYVRVLNPRVKRTGRKIDHGHQTSPGTKDTWSLKSTPSLSLRGMVVRHRKYYFFASDWPSPAVLFLTFLMETE
jgi:hypothetical protein